MRSGWTLLVVCWCLSVSPSFVTSENSEFPWRRWWTLSHPPTPLEKAQPIRFIEERTRVSSSPPVPVGGQTTPGALACNRKDIATATLTANALDHIKQHVSFSRTCNQQNGVWTIGYGHQCNGASDKYCQACQQRGTAATIDPESATGLLSQDLAPYETCVKGAIQVPVTDDEYGALVSLAQSITCGAFTSSSIVQQLNSGSYRNVPAQMKQYINSGGSPTTQLKRRRDKEATLFSSNNCANSQNLQGNNTNSTKSKASSAPQTPPPLIKQSIPGAPSWYHYMSPWWQAPDSSMPKPDQQALEGVVRASPEVMPYFNPYDSIMVETDSHATSSKMRPGLHIEHQRGST